MNITKKEFKVLAENLKFPEGPIVSPKPGPTLLIAVAAPDIDVSKSRPKTLKTPAVNPKTRI